MGAGIMVSSSLIRVTQLFGRTQAYYIHFDDHGNM